jgi:hypothetical protein
VIHDGGKETDHMWKRAASVSYAPHGIRKIYDANINLKMNKIFFIIRRSP